MLAGELVVLRVLLASHPKEMYGLEIVKASEGRVGRGVVYVYLERLEDSGFVASREAEVSDPRVVIKRRLYRLTDKGHRKLRDVEGEVPGGLFNPMPSPAS